MTMDKWSFGLTLLVVGVAGTFLTLWVLGLAVEGLKKLFPLAPEEKK
jgi:Na+-transporting methylmalonyl-CoA/oxaloacetate decarboxylase gamma subunit